MSNASVIEKNIVKPEVIKTEIVLSFQELDREKEKYLKQIQKSVSMPGFRPGKTPVNIIKKKYSNTAFYEGFEQLLKEKTNEVLTAQPEKVLYYVYNFDATGIIQDDGTDKKIVIEYILTPKVDINVKDYEIELVKYGFNDNQKKIFSDIIVLFNLLKPNSVEKIENFNDIFIIDAEIKSDALLNSEIEDKKKMSRIPFVVHLYQYKSYGLNEVLPAVVEKNQTYNIDAKKWLSILETNLPESKMHLKEFLKSASEQNDTSVSIQVKDINVYPEFNKYWNTEKIRTLFNLDEQAEINTELVYNKLVETIDVVAEYFSGNENIKRGNTFIQNLLQIEIPDDFIQKLYNNYVKEEDKKYFSVDLFKSEIVREIENKLLANILPNTFNPSTNYDEFATNVAKTYLVETLLSQMYLFDLQSTKNYIIHSLQNTDSKNREQVLQNYHNRDAVFSFAKHLSEDVKVTFKLENINQIHFNDYIGVSAEIFA